MKIIRTLSLALGGIGFGTAGTLAWLIQASEDHPLYIMQGSLAHIGLVACASVLFSLLCIIVARGA